MGNVLSEEAAEETFLKEGFNLESPEADKEINYGASVPRCQPKHTEAAAKQAEAQNDDNDNNSQEDTIEPNGGGKSSKNGSEAAEAKPKLSYLQMARMGYQELVNAIIRPPRADYKVCTKYVLVCAPVFLLFLLYIF